MTSYRLGQKVKVRYTLRGTVKEYSIAKVMKNHIRLSDGYTYNKQTGLATLGHYQIVD